MRRASRLWMTLAVGSLVCLPAARARAEQPRAAADARAAAASPGDAARAEALAAQAFEAFGQRNYQRALELYQQAFAIGDLADILFNIARVYDRGLNQPQRARDYYARYVEHPGAAAARVQLAEQRLEELRAEPAAAAPAVARAAPDVSAAPAAQPAELSDTNAWSTREWTAAILAGTGVVGLGVGVGFGWSAYSDRDIWRRDCTGNACSSQRALDAARSATRKANVATLALVSGGLLLGTGAALWLTSDDSTERSALRLQPLIGGSYGCTLSGSF
jgi:tetratricopeptide (TPR) repeat protein